MGHRKRSVTERYAKVVALLDHKMGDATTTHIGVRLETPDDACIFIGERNDGFVAPSPRLYLARPAAQAILFAFGALKAYLGPLHE